MMEVVRIFVADDDRALSELMWDIFQDAGYSVTLLKRGDNAYKEIKAAFPDLVTLDMRLAQQHTGWSVLHELKHDPDTAHIPIVVCSGDISLTQNYRSELENFGCYLLVKPFDIDTLLGVIEQALAAPPRSGRVA